MLDVLDAVVEARQCDDGFDTVLAKRAFELVVGVGGIERRNDGSELPGPELGDEKLRTVGKEQRDAVAAPNAECRKRRGAGVAHPLERGVTEGGAFEEERGMAGPITRGGRNVIDQSTARVRRQRRRDACVVVGEPRRR